LKGEGAEFERNGICKDRVWKLQGNENSRKGPKICIPMNLQEMEVARNGICRGEGGGMGFARNAYAYRRTMLCLSQFTGGSIWPVIPVIVR